MADNRTGKITQVIGAVLDIKFGSDNLPEINDAIDIQTKDGGKLVVEVAQHLGDDTGFQGRVNDAVGTGVDHRRGPAGLTDDTGTF